ncbi:MFS transporter [Nonomuraea endophytica]|uniref:MFS transporter n=1 Tax=Nonomuraea endophytica TaxID=714136 RepID=UPI0037CAD5AA
MWQLLRGNAPFRWLWVSRSVSFAGDSLSLVALMVYVASSTGEALAVSLLLLAGDFAPALFAPLTGAISDRYGHRRVMITCEFAQGALVLLIALSLPPLPVLLALVGLRAVIGQLFQAASRSVVPSLVPDRDLERANTAIGLGTNGGEALGPLAAWALLSVIDIRAVLLIDAATFLISGLVLTKAIRYGKAPDEPHTRGSLLSDTREGLRYILSHRLIRAVGLGFFAVVAFNGIDDVALVFLATDLGDPAAAGLLLAGPGIGLLVGYILLARRVPLQMGALLVAGFAVSSAGNLLTGFAWAVGAALAIQTIRGLGIAAMDVASTTLIQRNVAADVMGRTFATLYGAIGVAAALSYVAGGLLLDATSAATAFILAGTGGLLATVATAIALHRTPQPLRPEADPDEQRNPENPEGQAKP